MLVQFFNQKTLQQLQTKKLTTKSECDKFLFQLMMCMKNFGEFSMPNFNNAIQALIEAQCLNQRIFIVTSFLEGIAMQINNISDY